MNEEENQMVINNEELSSQLTGLNKTEGLTKEKKKLIIISSIVFSAIILIVIILIVTIKPKSKEEKKKEILGEINCVYDVPSVSRNTIILSNEFQKADGVNFDIEIDGKIVKYTKEYRFKEAGLNTVKFILYSPISIDFMFKDVFDVVSIDMYSEKNLEIKSMISAFEDCLNLYGITIKGFDTSKVTSINYFIELA